MARDYDTTNRVKTKAHRFNARLDDDEMDQVQEIMDSLGLNKTEVLTYLLDIHEHALKIIRDNR